jgi:hypothetical protein
MKSKSPEFKKLKSTPGMWIIYFIYLALIVALSIYCCEKIIATYTGELLPTKVFTVENDVVSLKLPDDWSLQSSSSEDGITFKSSTGYESLSIAKISNMNIEQAKIMYMLELNGEFPNATGSTLSYTEKDVGNKKMYVTQIVYENKYYLCGVRESGNTIIKFSYAASIMAGEIADIDEMINSINYREK